MSLAQTLEAAERFIAGFEDDTSQEGVQALLQRLRQNIPLDAVTLTPGAGAPHYFRAGCNFADAYSDSYFGRLHDSRYGCTWFGVEYQLDQHGRAWKRDYSAVIDDFGNLVEVSA